MITENRVRITEVLKFFSRSGLHTVLCTLFSVLCGSAYACPMCTELIEHGKDAFMAWRFGQGIAWSMLVMFLVPFSLVGGTTLYLVNNYRKTQNLKREKKGME